MDLGATRYYKRDFWINENLSYVKPHFRLDKCSRLVNDIAKGRKCDLLDVGCGPATLRQFLTDNITYHGIDIAIHNPAPYLIQADFVEGKIGFQDKRFDIVVAQGVFEYVGRTQSEKFAEIRQALKDDGSFVASYVNFDHLNRDRYVIYNNVQPAKEFRKSLESHFHVKRCFATSHHWHHHEPNRSYMKALQMPFRLNLPLISRLFAIEYFFICSPRRSDDIRAR